MSNRKLSSLRTNNSVELHSFFNSLPATFSGAKSTVLQATHYHAPGLYAREAIFKKGSFSVGRVHKFQHISIMLSGHMSLWTPHDGIKEVVGPSVSVVQPGLYRAGYAHTDVHWVCVIGKEAMDVPECDLLDMFTFSTFSEYKLHVENKGLIE